jgi:hypothetical protein
MRYGHRVRRCVRTLVRAHTPTVTLSWPQNPDDLTGFRRRLNSYLQPRPLGPATAQETFPGRRRSTARGHSHVLHHRVAILSEELMKRASDGSAPAEANQRCGARGEVDNHSGVVGLKPASRFLHRRQIGSRLRTIGVVVFPVHVTSSVSNRWGCRIHKKNRPPSCD